MMELLTRLIGAAYRTRRAQIKDHWKRVLPFGDVFTDRWEKARFLGFGEGASIYDSALVIGEVQVGAKTWIGPNCILDGSGGLTIGATCSISSGVQIYSHDTVAWAVSGGVAPYRQQATEIGDHVYVGPNTVIAAGSRIGKGCIVAAQSFVKGELAPFTFAVGSPARVIGRVNVAEDGSFTIIRAEAQPISSEDHP
jgi:acetyltransferase-like isoleucine patch superfamily enzyme